MGKHLIAPSILTADFLNLERTIDMINRSDADLLHLDIMDGVFVPNLTFGFPVIRQIRAASTKPLDVHLMVVSPDNSLEQYRDSGADWLTVHYETCTHLHRTVTRIRDLGMKPAVALNPHTDVGLLEPILGELNMVLVMTVNPGFGAQKFIPFCVDKIRKLKGMIERGGYATLIQIDGGVNENNLGELRDAGVDVFVAGNTVIAADDPLDMIRQLKSI